MRGRLIAQSAVVVTALALSLAARGGAGRAAPTLGEIYEYYPTITEVRVASGVFAFGFLIFTVLLKVAVPILLGDVRNVQTTATSGTGVEKPAVVVT